jgi:hypothetical protein
MPAKAITLTAEDLKNLGVSEDMKVYQNFISNFPQGLSLAAKDLKATDEAKLYAYGSFLIFFELAGREVEEFFYKERNLGYIGDIPSYKQAIVKTFITHRHKIRKAILAKRKEAAAHDHKN